MKQLLRSKRAVSPVLSAVLMILIVVTGMSLLFGFFVNYTRDFQLGSGSAVLESMTVEDVWFKSSANEAEVWVYNFGKVDSTITSVYVDDKLAGLKPGSDVEITVGEHGKLMVLYNGFQRYHIYTFKIVTNRGTALEGRYVWQ